MNAEDDLRLVRSVPALREIVDAPDLCDPVLRRTTMFNGGLHLTFPALRATRHEFSDDSEFIRVWDIGSFYAFAADGSVRTDYVNDGETLAESLARQPWRPARIVHVTHQSGPDGPACRYCEEFITVTCYTLDGHAELDALIAEARRPPVADSPPGEGGPRRTGPDAQPPRRRWWRLRP